MTVIAKELLQQIRRIQIRTNRIVNDIFAGQYESVFKGQGMEFKEVREYVPGDDIRMIDWNVTARTGSPHIKLLAEERELTVMLLVDMSGSQKFGSVQRFKSELAAELCAVVALAAIKNNDKVGLICFTDDVELYVPPDKGVRHVLRVIREVLYFQPSKKGTNIPAALRFMNGVSSRRTVTFLISDFLAEDYETPLRIAGRRHDVIAVVLEDPREKTLVDAGLVSLVDAETGKEVLLDTSDAKVRKKYEALANRKFAERDERLRRTRVDTIHLRTDRPYVQELYRFFRMRERRLA